MVKVSTFHTFRVVKLLKYINFLIKIFNQITIKVAQNIIA